MGFAALMVFGCVDQIRQAFRLRADPFPTWSITAPLWYEKLGDAAFAAVVAAACISYCIRITSRKVRGAAQPVVVPWRDKLEIRVVLYVWAASLLLRPLIGVIKIIKVTPIDPVALWILIISDGLIVPAIGIAVIIYDQQRIKREFRLNTGRCLLCGYDLRASPSKCPECGANVESIRVAPPNTTTPNF